MDSPNASANASQLQMDYMTLLITQLRNQNPLEPLSNDQMASQMAQFSQLQQLETMNHRFEDLLTAAEKSYATELIGKQVTFSNGSEDTAGPLSGTVDGLTMTDGDATLLVGAYPVQLGDILSVENPTQSNP